MAWIGAVASIAGALISSDSASSASDAQTRGTQSAIDEQRRQYDLNRSDLAPYRDAGTAALSRLRLLMGLSRHATSNASSTMPTREQFRTKGTGSNPLALIGPSSGVLSVGPGGAVSSGYWDTDINGQPTQWIPTAADNGTIDEAAYQKALAAWNAANADTGTPDEGYGDLTRKFNESDLSGDVVYNKGLQFGLDEGTKALERRAAASGGYDSGAELKALTRFGNDYGSTKAGDAYSRFRDWQDSQYGKLSGVSGMGIGATTVGVNAGSNTASNLSSLYAGLGNSTGASILAGGNALSSGFTNAANMYNQNNLLKQLTGGGARSLNSGSTPDYYGTTESTF